MSGGPWEIGTRDDPESVAGSGTLIAILKRVRSLLTGGVGSIDVSDRVGRLLGRLNNYGEAAVAAHVHEPAANTAAIVTLAAAGAGISNVLGIVFWSYDILPAAGSLTIEDGAGTTVIKVDVPESGPGFLPFNPGLRGTVNTLMRATLAAGGAGVSGIVSLHAWTE